MMPGPLALTQRLAAIPSMPRMLNRASAVSRTRALALAGALFATALVAGCGDDDSATSTASKPAPNESEFPAANGQTLDELLASTQPTNELVASPSGMVFTPGSNRFGFGLFTVDGEQVTDGEVAIYAAHGAKGKAIGPFPARVESLATEPEFEAKTTSSDPDAAKVVYVTDVDFGQPGEWRLLAMIRQDDDKLVATRLPSLKIGPYSKIPEVGDKAPVVDTPTASEVGDLSEIDTRDPHDTMHDVNFADVVGEKPVVLLFATPALCLSRVCGPVVDVAEQVKSEVGDDVAFIHMEVYEDNDPNKGIRPQLAAYGLRTEPWLFVIDSDGRVSTRIEGAFSAEELHEAIEKAS
jgi:hypothetical protein